MKHTIIALILLFGTSMAQAKSLTVQCEGADDRLALAGELANASAPVDLKSFEINGTPIAQLKDVSSYPVYKDGVITMRLAFGKMLYNSVEVQVSKCQDDFEANGSALLKKYVGGFAGTSQSKLNCRCALK
jgi:hypothetical protein